LGEIGWYEIIYQADIARLMFYHSLMNKDTSNICKKVIMNQLQQNDNPKTWISMVQRLLCKLNLQYQDVNLISVKNWKKSVLMAIHAKASLAWIAGMNRKAKLRTYVKFKNNLSYETYLDDSDNRKFLLLKLRVGTNNLEIEKGRHQNKPISLRNCRFCSGVEDESHFLLECPGYADIRENLQRVLLASYDISDINLEVILNQPNLIIRKVIYECIADCYKRRSSIETNG